MVHIGGEVQTAAQVGDRKLRLWLAWHVMRFCCFARFRCVGAGKNSDLAHDAVVDMRVTIMQECFTVP